VLILDMIVVLPPLEKYKYGTWRILPMKCYIDNFMRLRSYIRNVNSWVNVMHEELENFERNQVWTLVEPPRDVNVIGTKWVFKNKQGEVW
jgi:hypothetical protein